MAVQSYIRGFQKVPYDVRNYISAVNVIFEEADADIGVGWTKDDVTYIDSGAFITVIITYGAH